MFAKENARRKVGQSLESGSLSKFSQAEGHVQAAFIRALWNSTASGD